jgi:tryptophan-rich sensory protein
MYKHWNQISIRNILILGLVLNLTWVPIFAANTQIAFAVIIAMIAVAGKTLQLLYADDTLHSRDMFMRSSTLFAPYLAWILFASSLNAYLAQKC